MKKIIPFILLFICMLTGCGGGDVYRRVARDKDRCPSSSICILRELYRFEWDSVYVLDGNQSIPEALRCRFFAPEDTGDPDLSRKIIFLKDGRTVRVESETKISEPHPVSLTGEQWAFTPEDAVFNIESYDYHGRIYYELTPVWDEEGELR